jgi:uncharacterized SAM-dependent methyltransferase
MKLKREGDAMNYVAYSNYQQLSKCFQDAVANHQNSMLEARNIENSGHDFAASVANGLNQSPPMLEYRFLYNAQGSALYEQITAQPEYYLTRSEAGILRKKAEEISLLTGPCNLIELGSGCSVKTDYLLSAYQNNYSNVC